MSKQTPPTTKTAQTELPTEADPKAPNLAQIFNLELDIRNIDRMIVVNKHTIQLTKKDGTSKDFTCENAVKTFMEVKQILGI